MTVEAAADLVENDSTFHSDWTETCSKRFRLESTTSSLSSEVTLSTPGIAADSNGLFHGLGDHAENSFSVDGQPITDQQSKVFSNQLPLDSVQSMEVISGAPPAEYGGKTSVVIVATTRSGQGVTSPHGSVTASYGSFGTSNLAAELAYGGKKWGNFISANGLNTGRFLDPPEFTVFHDKGNEAESVRPRRLSIQQRGLSSLELRLQPELVSDAEFVGRRKRYALEWTRRNLCLRWRPLTGVTQMEISSGRQISAPRSGRSTLHLRGRMC